MDMRTRHLLDASAAAIRAMQTIRDGGREASLGILIEDLQGAWLRFEDPDDLEERLEQADMEVSALPLNSRPLDSDGETEGRAAELERERGEVS